MNELLLKNFERKTPARRSGPAGNPPKRERGESATMPTSRQTRKLVVEKSSARPPSNRLDAGLIPPAPAKFRRNTGERSSTDDSACGSRKLTTRRGAPRRRQQPRQDGLSTRWHLRDRRGCIPSCRGCLRSQRRGARTTHARRRERHGASSTRRRDDRRPRVPAATTLNFHSRRCPVCSWRSHDGQRRSTTRRQSRRINVRYSGGLPHSIRRS